MKIRTDFVTNSSSSSFIAIKAITKEGKRYLAKLDSGNTAIDVDNHYGRFEYQAKDFESFETIADLFKIIYHWFYETLKDPACAFDEVDDALRIYGSGDFKKIVALRKENLRFASIFSREEYWDEPFGASLIAYDYESNSFFEEHRDLEIFQEDQEDSYGSKLEKRFYEAESFGAIRFDSEIDEDS